MWLHLVRANPVFGALAENPLVLLSVAGDWAFIPSSWKAIGDEDPALGIPTTYYGAVQLVGTATVHDERTEPGSVAAILRRQLTALPAGRRGGRSGRGPRGQAARILGISITVEQVSAKFKYGGNVDGPHRLPWWSDCASGAAPGDVVGGKPRSAATGHRTPSPRASVNVGQGRAVAAPDGADATSRSAPSPNVPPNHSASYLPGPLI